MGNRSTIEGIRCQMGRKQCLPSNKTGQLRTAKSVSELIGIPSLNVASRPTVQTWLVDLQTWIVDLQYRHGKETYTTDKGSKPTVQTG